MSFNIYPNSSKLNNDDINNRDSLNNSDDTISDEETNINETIYKYQRKYISKRTGEVKYHTVKRKYNKKKNVLTKELLEEIKLERESGSSIYKIALKFRISNWYVKKALKELNMK